MDFYKKITKQSLEEDFGFPSLEEIYEETWRQASSRHKLLELGKGTDNVVTVTEEEREHTHIIGTTGEGKSKLLEYLIRDNIDRGHGVCFLDPSDRGDTLYNILRYCYKKGVDKICLIDPFHRFTLNTVPIINPFHYNHSYKDASVANVMDTLRVLFKTADAAETPRIQRYLPAILRILWASKSTLRDSVYFTQKGFELFRQQMYEDLDIEDRDVMMIEDLYRTVYTQRELQSTINRLQPFYDSTLELIFGHTEGINFPKMISEGWVILVNLYSGFGFEPIHTRLLGTTIINELIFSLDRLRNKGWRGVYYLYVDEAGRYANRNLADLLAYKRKSGLRVTIAHQYFNQFEDKYVLDAINNLCKLKIAFYMPNREDRDKFVRLAYGGELADRDVSYVLSGQRKQHAVIKKPKKPPHIVRIPDVSTLDIPKDKLESFILKLYSQGWYKSPKEVTDSFNARFPTTKDTNGPQPGKAPYRQAASKASVPRGVQQRREKRDRLPKGNEKPEKDEDSGPIKI